MNIELLLAIVGSLISILLALVAWIGTRIHGKLDRIPEQLQELNNTLHKIEIELRKELSGHEGRIGILETRVKIHHPEDQ
jgi:hypothetical protein